MLDTTGIEQEYLDTPTLAKLAGVTTNIIQMDIKHGVLPAEKRPDSRCARWGGCWFIRANDAQKYIDMRKAVVQGITASELSRRTGKSDTKILEAIKRGELPAFRFVDEAKYPWHIPEEEARKYSQHMGWKYVIDGIDQLNGYNRVEVSIPPTTGSPDLCGSCSTEKGNILGDIDKKTHERYGYLCARCHQLVRDFHRDVARMRNVLSYIERTRLPHV